MLFFFSSPGLQLRKKHHIWCSYLTNLDRISRKIKNNLMTSFEAVISTLLADKDQRSNIIS